MDIRMLRTFIYVAELAGFTKAAAALGYSQSTVSFQIKQLERELDAKLFERINHTVTLTDAGREVLRYAHRINQLAQEMEAATQREQEVAGHVRLAMADSLCPALLGERFLAFRRDCPGISLKIITAGTEEMFRLLDHNEVDLVLTLDSHIYNTDYLIVKEKKIGAHFVAAGDAPLAGREQLSIRELLDQPFLLTEKGMSYRRLMDEKLAERSLEITPVLEIGDTDRLCRLVEQGAGISFLPDHVTAASVQTGRMTYLPVDDFSVEIWKQLLHHRDKWISPPMQRVMEYCAGCLDG